jgi:hypothetical protein
MYKMTLVRNIKPSNLGPAIFDLQSGFWKSTPSHCTEPDVLLQAVPAMTINRRYS